MAEGICLQGKRISVMPKLESDPEYYVFRDSLQAFEQRLNDPPYIDSLLTPQQVQEKNQLISRLNSSSTLPNQIRNRLRQYDLHYEPRSYYNAILQRDLSSPTNNHMNNHQSWDNSPHSHRRSHSMERGQNYYPNQGDNGYFQQNEHQQRSLSHYHSQPELDHRWQGPSPPHYGHNHSHQHQYPPSYDHHMNAPPPEHYGNHQHQHYSSPNRPLRNHSFNNYDTRHPPPPNQHFNSPHFGQPNHQQHHPRHQQPQNHSWSYQ